MSSTIAGTALPMIAAHADAGRLYVNNVGSAHCSDAGAGTQAQPFCHVQAAADAAQPGQTVWIAPGYYPEQVTLTHSGTPGNPITFDGPVTLGETSGAYYRYPKVMMGAVRTSTAAPGHPHAFLASSGVHDITIRHLRFETPQEAVLLSGADHVTLDGNSFTSAGAVSAGYPNPAPAVRLANGTTNTTISRNEIDWSGAAGVAVDSGVAGTVVTTNLLGRNAGGGVVVTDAPGTVVTSNTVSENCGAGVTLAGNSSAATVENNIIVANYYQECPSGTNDVELSVSAASASGTKADYNVVRGSTAGIPYGFQYAYAWAGTDYSTAAAFTTATGQGGHDLGIDPKIDAFGGTDTFAPTTDTAAMDSADATAPGELDTDFYGRPRVDDPLVDNTGTGTGIYDRGAIEYQNPMSLAFWPSSDLPPAGHPLDVTLVGTGSAPWYPVSGTLAFGDGSSTTVNSAAFRVVHTYAAPGTYDLTLTMTDTSGASRTTYARAVVQPVGPIQANLSAQRAPGLPLSDAVATAAGSVSPWPVATYGFDFGDGTPALVFKGPNNPGEVFYHYTNRGRYSVQLTLTDDHGRTATSAAQTVSANLSLPGDVPVAGKWVKGQPSTVGIFNSGSWELRQSNSAGIAAVTKVGLGQVGDLPAVGDWDGVGHDQVGIFRQGVFALRHEDGSVTAVPFGAPGDVPVPGLWDHNGHAQLAVYRPSIATFAVRHDDGSVSTAALGNAGDVPLVGDWDGVGHTQMGIYRQGLFALRHDDGSISTATYGAFGDQPIVGDWQGAGRTAFGIYRPGIATYALNNAYAGAQDSVTQLY